jgi:hypothetical protein
MMETKAHILQHKSEYLRTPFLREGLGLSTRSVVACPLATPPFAIPVRAMVDDYLLVNG